MARGIEELIIERYARATHSGAVAPRLAAAGG